MKHFSTVFLIGLILPLSLIQAEHTLLTPPIYKLTEEAPLTELDEEIFFLEDEFETELISLKEEQTESPLIEAVTLVEPEEKTETFPLAQTEEPAAPVVTTEVVKIEAVTPEELPPATLVIEEPALIGEPTHFTSSGVTVDLSQAFSGSPIIYSVLLGMSIFSICLWLYSLASIKLSTRISSSLIHQVQNQLGSNNFNEALDICNNQNNLLSKMLATGIQSRRYGLPMVIESMKAEAKRSTVFFWQKLGLLNDIAIIAPMLGLLGTVLGMFYAFYDVNRSIESISTLFDGLGISVGTTVAGLVVAIVALILHSTAKYRLVRALAKVENEAQRMVPLIDNNTHIHKG